MIEPKSAAKKLSCCKPIERRVGYPLLASCEAIDHPIVTPTGKERLKCQLNGAPGATQKNFLEQHGGSDQATVPSEPMIDFILHNLD